MQTVQMPWLTFVVGGSSVPGSFAASRETASFPECAPAPWMGVPHQAQMDVRGPAPRGAPRSGAAGGGEGGGMENPGDGRGTEEEGRERERMRGPTAKGVVPAGPKASSSACPSAACTDLRALTCVPRPAPTDPARTGPPATEGPASPRPPPGGGSPGTRQCSKHEVIKRFCAMGRKDTGAETGARRVVETGLAAVGLPDPSHRWTGVGALATLEAAEGRVALDRSGSTEGRCELP